VAQRSRSVDRRPAGGPREKHYLHTIELHQKIKEAAESGVRPTKKAQKAKEKVQKARRRKARKLVSYLTTAEQERFFRSIRSERDKAIFRLLYHHGLRASEIGLLRMCDYRKGISAELDRLYIHRLKGSVSGETAMVPAASTALRAWLRKRGYKEGAIFVTRQKTAIGRVMIFRLMRKYCKLAGIPKEKAHPHTLKHTCCTHLVSYHGESILDVQRHVGHTNIKSTMVYAELSDEANEARARRLRDWS
jgi:integrase